jgi:hypothetical protein
MNIKLIKTILVVIAVIAILAGCQSLPEPSSPSDTLVVVDVDRENEEGGSIFGTLVLTIAPVNAPDDTTELSLNASKAFETKQGLPAGTYRATDLRWEYQETTKTQEYKAPNDTFIVDDGAISIYPYRFYYTVEDGRMSFGWRPMDRNQRAEFISEELATEDAFMAWRVLE